MHPSIKAPRFSLMTQPIYLCTIGSRRVSVEENDNGFESIVSIRLDNYDNKSSRSKISNVKRKWSNFLQVLSSNKPENKRYETSPIEKHHYNSISEEKVESSTKQEKKLRQHPLMLKDENQLEYDNKLMFLNDEYDDTTVDTYSTSESFQELESCASSAELSIESIVSIEWEKKTTISKAGRIASIVAKTLIVILSIVCIAGLYVMLL